MRMLFSGRMVIEKQFESYCKEHGTDDNTGNFLAWLLSTHDGNIVVVNLYHDVISDMLDGITRRSELAGKQACQMNERHREKSDSMKLSHRRNKRSDFDSVHS